MHPRFIKKKDLQKLMTSTVAPLLGTACYYPVITIIYVRYFHLYALIEYHVDGVGSEQLLLVFDELLEETAIGLYPRPAKLDEVVGF